MPALANSRHEQFAQRVASGAAATHAYVAAGYSQKGAAQSSHRLLRDARIQARIAEIRQEIGSKLAQAKIREISERIQALEERWLKLRQIIAERAAAKEMQGVPGGQTGLLAVRYKSLGERIIMEYEVDTGLLRELREHEAQAAKELRQWTDRHEHTVSVDIVERLRAGRARLLTMLRRNEAAA